MKKTIYLVSLHGLENVGGLERVNAYLYEILSKKYNVKIIHKTKKPFRHGNWLFQSLLISLKLFFIPNKVVIGTSWHSFLYPCDVTFHHGTTLGYMTHRNNFYKAGKRIATMEHIGAITARKNLVVGEHVKDELIEYYHIPLNKITVLNNFVNDKLFTDKSEEKKQGKIIIGFVGRLEDGKGLDKLIALSNYIENLRGFELSIATHSQTNTDFFKKNKKTHIATGLSKEQMPNFYNSVDILYFPTQYEGFSMATLESLSCGTPVVGTNWALGRELEQYPFTTTIEYDLQPEKLIPIFTDLHGKFCNKRSEIHSAIASSFGREHYEKKLFEIIDPLMER